MDPARGSGTLVVGTQYDDDLNTFLLRRYFVMDLMASHPLTRALDVFIAADNLLNQRYDIARTPVLNVAPPILARAGLRLNLGGRSGLQPQRHEDTRGVPTSR